MHTLTRLFFTALRFVCLLLFRALRSQLERLQEEIESIQAQTEDQNRQLQELLEDKTERKIVFSRDPRHRNPQLANEVSVLHFNKDIEYDSD